MIEDISNRIDFKRRKISKLKDSLFESTQVEEKKRMKRMQKAFRNSEIVLTEQIFRLLRFNSVLTIG
jgi:hypothetical protein